MPYIFDLLDSVNHMMDVNYTDEPDSRYTKLSDEAIAMIENIDNHKVVCQTMFDGYRYTCNFNNGYGISVIKHSGSYGGSDDQFELAVLKDDDLCYETSITNDVLGYLTEDEVVDTAKKVAALDT